MRRLLVTGAVVAGLLGLASCAPAPSATTIGHLPGDGAVPGPCTSGFALMQQSGSDWDVPAGSWNLTSWSYAGSPTDAGTLRLVVLAPDNATVQGGTVVAATPTVPVGPGLNTFTLDQPLAVEGGQVLGTVVGSGTLDCVYDVNAAGAPTFSALTLNATTWTPGDTVAFALEYPGRLDVTATLTPR